ncbi:MAG TPA: MgtC/SapB family protein [Nitrospirales bacterium]|nr:MgtC/SapB family protein [Nitrospira sp. MA-1]HNP59671.1 MgtC/SapB family protein [Nitrospirales bacterium]
MDGLIDLNWHQVWSHLYHLLIAFLLAVPLGWDREHESRGAGLRTFPLVAVGSCAYMLTGINVLNSTDAEARVIYGILTGIGFIGGGAILKERGNVAGTATAASIWNTGAIGMAVAWDRYEIALVLSVLNFLTFRFMPLLKNK